MIAHTYSYVLLEDVCEHNKLDYETVMMAISESNISFGTNYDTFISSTHLDSILADTSLAWPVGFRLQPLDYDKHDEDNGYVLISLGS
jgi:hypothetical protein